jgi:1,4-dihydroxy-2-naphthoyl-CoA synthase
MCRKVALAKDGGEIEVWGDGKQTRSFLHVDECVEGVLRLMRSDYTDPLNIGSDEMVTINQLADMKGLKFRAYNRGTSRIAELTGAFRALADEPGVRAIVLTGNGPAFCAGADLNWMKKMAGYSDDENRADALRLAEMLRAIYTCPKPVIARVQGDTYAGGVGLVAACDIVVAVDTANFCLSEAKLGLIPATISPYVIRALGEQASRRYFITAERFSAAEAHRLGLVHELMHLALLEEPEVRKQKALAEAPVDR